MFSQDNWKEFIAAMNRGDLCEIDADIYYYFLGVLPPAWMNKTKNVQGVMRACDFGFVEGWDYVVAFWSENYWEENAKYFCQKTTEFVRG